MPLPPEEDVETKQVLKKAAEAHRYLAELKGLAYSLPNPHILIDTLSLQEGRESSAIENIVSTFEEVYQSNYQFQAFASPAAKEVHAYARALKLGCERLQQNSLLTLRTILDIQAEIVHNHAGLRKLPGTRLIHETTGKVVYEPPQDPETIKSLMTNLVAYINDKTLHPVDPLIKMAIIHYQFESIHPFYDGNGRTGRIINILYLIKEDLLTIPILYLSRYIFRHKADYYRLLQEVRLNRLWEDWILYMLEAVSHTSQSTLQLIRDMEKTMQHYASCIRKEAPRMFSQELLNHLFSYPYTKIEYLMHNLQVSRNTAIRYLEKLQEINLIEKRKSGRSNFYMNKQLVQLLMNSA